MNVASRKERYVNSSHFYHESLRGLLKWTEEDGGRRHGHDYDHRVANIVVLAAFVTEATINEVAYWLHTHLTTPIEMPARFDRFPIRRKWQALPQACGAPRFDEGQRPWQDFNALIELRNVLAHASAYPEAPEKVVQVLEVRGCAQPAGDWFESIMTLRTARWASETSAAMPQALKALLEPRIDLRNGGFSWQWGPEWLQPVR